MRFGLRLPHVEPPESMIFSDVRGRTGRDGTRRDATCLLGKAYVFPEAPLSCSMQRHNLYHLSQSENSSVPEEAATTVDTT